jgi:DNA-directed RNA polymerase specialized sigma24 family protein
MPSLQSIEISAEILNRARTGDIDAHEYIYRALSKPVYTLIRRLVIRPAVAEELLQDAFARLKKLKHELRQLPSFEPPEHAWPLVRERLERLPR